MRFAAIALTVKPRPIEHACGAEGLKTAAFPADPSVTAWPLFAGNAAALGLAAQKRVLSVSAPPPGVTGPQHCFVYDIKRPLVPSIA